MSWEAVIGIETHVEFQTESKMFCSCPVAFGAEPNTNVCPVCLGLPGALPVPNEKAIEWTMALGSALGCTIAPWSLFHRKNYFYADLPKNYQISQFDLPLCVGGHVDIETEAGPRRVGITRVHLEEDTGKSTHIGASGRIHASESTLLDFNRSGVPLMEVVTEPDIRTPDEARAYATELRAIVLALEISDARLEEGSLRFDANISLRPAGTEPLGVKVEVKNMNSLRSLRDALAFEIERQTAVLDSGQTVDQETRHWDEEHRRSEPGRSKEESSDYRYLTEPDLVPLSVDGEKVAVIIAGLPELPAARRARYTAMGLGPALARVVVVTDGYPELLEEAVGAGGNARSVANWLTGEVTAAVRRSGSPVSSMPLSGGDLAELAAMVDAGELSSTAAKEVLGGTIGGEGAPREVAEACDLIQIQDAGALRAAVDEVLAAHPDELARAAAGETKLIGFLVGQVMRASGGKADPEKVGALIRDRADA